MTEFRVIRNPIDFDSRQRPQESLRVDGITAE
jgi:hypothetical protein